MKLGRHEFELGIFVKCPHPEMIEAIQIAGFDFAVVDMEHTPLSPRDLYPLVLAAERRGLSLVVRIPAKEDAYFKWCRDLNVSRIQVPHVETAEDARHAARHSYFAPIGQRGLCRFVRAADFSGTTKDDYLTAANAIHPLILQIEGAKALANVPAIIDAVPAGNALFIGPYDLSQSLGKPGQIWDPEVVRAMETIVAQCQAKSMRLGTFADTPEGVCFWAERGLSYIEYGSDLNLFIGSAQHLKAAIAGASGARPAHHSRSDDRD